MSNSTTSNVSVLLVDDHEVVRQGTKDMLAAHPRIDVIGEAGSGEELAGLIQLKQPDILLLDINLPGQNGIELLEALRPQFPNLKIILFSAFMENQYIRRIQALHADGYLSKTIGQYDLQNAVLKVAQGQGPVYSADILQHLNSLQGHQQSDTPEVTITPREQEILIEVAHGQTNQAIAKKLVLSVKTVDSHVANLMKKLNVNRRTQLATYAYEQGLI